MPGYCAKCGQTSEGQMLCPRCGIRLTDDGGTLSTVPLSQSVADDSPDGPPFLRRLVLGAITLLGLFHGLKHLALVATLSSGGTAGLAPEGVLGLLVGATLVGSIAAGTVNRRAELAGFLLGLAAGVGVVGLDVLCHVPVPELWLIGVPILLALVGALGGLAGRLMVPPAPTIPRFGYTDSRVLDHVKLPGPRLTWWQVGLGAALAVVGTAAADPARQTLQQMMLTTGTSFSSNRMITWQISLLAALVGGVAAGANTRIGFRQGLAAGLLAAVGAAGVVAANGPDRSMLVEFWQEQFGLAAIGPATYAGLGGCVVVLTALGGWLGGHILPPPPSRRR